MDFFNTKMLLIFFITSVFGKPSPMKINSGYGGMQSLIWSYSNLDILQHGCHCSEIGLGLDIYRHSSNIDETDGICKQWIESRPGLVKIELNSLSIYGPFFS